MKPMWSPWSFVSLLSLGWNLKENLILHAEFLTLLVFFSLFNGLLKWDISQRSRIPASWYVSPSSDFLSSKGLFLHVLSQVVITLPVTSPTRPWVRYMCCSTCREDYLNSNRKRTKRKTQTKPTAPRFHMPKASVRTFLKLFSLGKSRTSEPWL